MTRVREPNRTSVQSNLLKGLIAAAHRNQDQNQTECMSLANQRCFGGASSTFVIASTCSLIRISFQENPLSHKIYLSWDLCLDPHQIQCFLGPHESCPVNGILICLAILSQLTR